MGRLLRVGFILCFITSCSKQPVRVAMISDTVPQSTTITTTTSISTTTSRAKHVSRGVRLYIPRNVNWDKIAFCETGGTMDWATNTGNGFYGGLQFSHSTWISNGGGQYAYNAHLTSRENQIAIASHMALSNWPICGRRG